MARLVRAAAQLVPEGEYYGYSIKYTQRENVPTSYGLKNKISLTFKFDNGMEFTRTYNDDVFEGSFLGIIATELLGYLPGQDFDRNLLIGIRCKLVIEHSVDENGKTWADIVEISLVDDDVKVGVI